MAVFYILIAGRFIHLVGARIRHGIEIALSLLCMPFQIQKIEMRIDFNSKIWILTGAML